MSKQTKNEKPEVYALRKEGTSWQFSRRDFLKAAGLGAAVMGIGLGSRFVRPAHAADDLETLCKSSLAHAETITHLLASPDGRYLLSRDSSGLMKCWDFRNYALLNSAEEAFDQVPPKATGYLGAEQMVFSEEGQYYELPLAANASAKALFIDVSSFENWTIDRDENIYSVRDGNSIYVNKNADDYKNDTLLCTPEEPVLSLRYLEGSRKLFIQMKSGFAVLDPESGDLRSFGTDCPVYAILPGDSRVLICDASTYSVNSLIDGRQIWSRPYSALNASPKITGVAVSPDGSLGVIGTSDHRLWAISMADGTPLKDRSCGTSGEGPQQLVMAKDGSQFAAAVGQSILFISLPDFEVIGCPVDLKEMKDESKGIEVQGTDPVTGQTYTYTLPCGAPIPDGAICVCNCVAGSVCSCVGHTVCTCDTVCSCVGNRVCTCDTVCSCVGHVVSGGHYWHPN